MSFSSSSSPPPYATAAVIVVCATTTLAYVCVRGLLSRPAHTSLVTHACVALTLLPLALLVTLMLVSTTDTLREHLPRAAAQPWLPRPVAALLTAAQLPRAQMSLLDVQATACLLLVSYGSVVVWRRGIDVVRLLKVSQRRMLHADAQTVS